MKTKVRGGTVALIAVFLIGFSMASGPQQGGEASTSTYTDSRFLATLRWHVGPMFRETSPRWCT